MTSLTHLRQAHASGTLPKPYFLGAVYALVQPLFEFQASLAGTQIKEIIIGTNNVRVKVAENNLELIFRTKDCNALLDCWDFAGHRYHSDFKDQVINISSTNKKTRIQ